MWYKLGRFIIKHRFACLFALLAITIFMGYEARKVSLSYDFTNAVPATNPKYIAYQNFKKDFGEDGNEIILGIQTDSFFRPAFFNTVCNFDNQLKSIDGVTAVLGVPEMIALSTDGNNQFKANKIFKAPYSSQDSLDKALAVFKQVDFYKNRLYNPQTQAYLFVLSLKDEYVNSAKRTALLADIEEKIKQFEQEHNLHVYISGLPYIRIDMANRVAVEMRFFLFASLFLSALSLFLFFRSFATMVLSLSVVLISVVWCMATIVLLGYKITLLTALIPPLLVVIGIPNCIYFINKYHTSYLETNDKETALINMIGKMGVVTLFCNIAAGIGFAVFAFTKSSLLKEFGIVAGLNIMGLFFISLFLLPTMFHVLAPPTKLQLRYLQTHFIDKILLKIERAAFENTKPIVIVTVVIVIVSVVGIFRLKSEGFIVDDLPKKDAVYTDLLWFQDNIKGVLPLEVSITAKRKRAFGASLTPIYKIDSLSRYIERVGHTGKPMSFVEGLKFAKQAYYGGDSGSYSLPTNFEMVFLAPYFREKPDTSTVKNKNSLATAMSRFMDSTRQKVRITMNMPDVGSAKLPILLDSFQKESNRLFDTAHYKVVFTGSSVIFLEGINFIISGLIDSILWAFLLIAVCMFYLFRSFRILICSLIPNIIPLLITAGIMGWARIPLKPSTVLIFSVALGIAVDITIRFLVNFKQELPINNFNVDRTLRKTIKHTGISILYTSFVLVAGFIVFCFSNFGGTRFLGWLTSLTLIISTVTNLVLLPILIMWTVKKKPLPTRKK